MGPGVVNIHKNTWFHHVKGLHCINQRIAVYGISADFQAPEAHRDTLLIPVIAIILTLTMLYAENIFVTAYLI